MLTASPCRWNCQSKMQPHTHTPLSTSTANLCPRGGVGSPGCGVFLSLCACVRFPTGEAVGKERVIEVCVCVCVFDYWPERERVGGGAGVVPLLADKHGSRAKCSGWPSIDSRQTPLFVSRRHSNGLGSLSVYRSKQMERPEWNTGLM